MKRKEIKTCINQTRAWEQKMSFLKPNQQRECMNQQSHRQSICCFNGQKNNQNWPEDGQTSGLGWKKKYLSTKLNKWDAGNKKFG
jgi:hypothetical protein